MNNVVRNYSALAPGKRRPARGECEVRAPVEPDMCIDDSAVLRRALGETPS
jgi:hypothetical protein